MPLLNYTTEIDVEKTVGEIQKLLATHGAQKIMIDYSPDGQYVEALTFAIPIKGRLAGFRLPTDWKPVLDVMERQGVRKGYLTQEQAVRVAWRIVKDWVKAQMAIVDTRMVKLQDVFLPYATMNDGRTLAEHFEDKGENLLGPGQ